MRRPARMLLRCRGSGGGCRRVGLLEAVGPAELLAEPLDAAGGVDELLFAREERVAGATDVDVDAGRRAAGGERISAGAVDIAGLITGVDLRLHGATPWPGTCVA